MQLGELLPVKPSQSSTRASRIGCTVRCSSTQFHSCTTFHFHFHFHWYRILQQHFTLPFSCFQLLSLVYKIDVDVPVKSTIKPPTTEHSTQTCSNVKKWPREEKSTLEACCQQNLATKHSQCRPYLSLEWGGEADTCKLSTRWVNTWLGKQTSILLLLTTNYY